MQPGNEMTMNVWRKNRCQRIRTLFGLYKIVKIQPRIAGIEVSKHICPAYLGEKKGTEKKHLFVHKEYANVAQIMGDFCVHFDKYIESSPCEQLTNLLLFY